MRTKASIDLVNPSLARGLQMDVWVYDHPCIVLRLYKHQSKGRIVQVAPVRSRQSSILFHSKADADWFLDGEAYVPSKRKVK
jgi:hypothetical protein